MTNEEKDKLIFAIRNMSPECLAEVVRIVRMYEPPLKKEGLGCHVDLAFDELKTITLRKLETFANGILKTGKYALASSYIVLTIL